MSRRSLVVSAFVCTAFLSVPQSAYASLLTIGHLDGSSIIWDGDSDVRTSNINGVPTMTSIALGDPTDLRITHSLTGDDSAEFFLQLYFSADLRGLSEEQLSTFNDTAPADWQRFLDIFPGGQGDFFEVDTGNNPSLGDLRTVGLSFYMNVTQPGTFTISATNQTLLNALLAANPDTNFFIGMTAVIQGDSLAEGGLATFDVSVPGDAPAPVPEPSTMMLLGIGLAGLYRSRRHQP